MKIAIVRGPSLNDWEIQNYLPLAEKHELLVVGSPGGKYKLDGKIKVRSLLCLGQLFNFIPGGIKFLYHLYGDSQVLWGLEKEVVGFDIVHTAELANYYSFQAIKARQKGLVKKVVVTCWENILGAREDYPAQKRIKKAVIERGDHFLAATQQAKKTLIKEGIVPSKITVIPMGVDLEKFKVKSLKLKVEKNKDFEILFVGRLVEEKGVWELLRAFRELLNSYKALPLKLRMIGSGSLEKKIRRLLEEWGLSEKVIIEKKSYREMPTVYQGADIFVLPSKPIRAWQEQFGMVLVEAMACGVPVVATKSGAIPEVVGGAGILVTPGNASELSETIIKVIKDEKLRDDLSVKGRQRAEVEYDCRKAALKIEKLYREVIGG